METSSKQSETADTNHIEENLGKYSYLNLETIALKSDNLNSPFPSQLDYEDCVNLMSKEPLKDFVIKDPAGVCCTDEEVVKKQSGIFYDMAKQLAKGIFGSGSLSISLPIRAFEPKGMLERYVDWWVNAPIYLKKAALVEDKLEVFKNVIAFTLSSLFLSTSQMKPLNPIVGETFEGEFEDGSKVYLEHTSHIPCVSNFLIIDKDNLYKYSGYQDISLEGTIKLLYSNSVTIVQKGKSTVQFTKSKQKISFMYPKLVLGGILYGTRSVSVDGHMKFEDRENNLKAVIYFNKSHPNISKRRFHDIYGQIFHHQYSNKKETFYESSLPKKPFPTDKKLIYAEITGSWLENIVINNEIIWSISNYSHCQLYPVKYPIYSDSRYREDLIWLKRAVNNPEYNKIYLDYAQRWKLALETQHRHDRKLREKKKKK